MRKLLAPLFALSISIVLAGCGGLSSIVPNTLAGTYAGNFTSSNGDSGTANITIGSDGTLSGTITDVTNSSQTGTITGSVSVLGIASGTFHYTSSTANVSGTFTSTSSGVNATILIGSTTTDTLTLAVVG